MVGYVANFLALISLLANSSVSCCWHCLPCHGTAIATAIPAQECDDGQGDHCCHSEGDDCCDEHHSDEGDALASGCCPHPHGSDCPCRPGRCVKAVVSAGIAPQSVSLEWVWCRSLTTIGDLSKPTESCSLIEHNSDDECYGFSASLFRAMTQVWLI